MCLRLRLRHPQECILAYNKAHRGTWAFGGLVDFLQSRCTPRERIYIQGVLIPRMAQRALALPDLAAPHVPVPVLRRGTEGSVRLSRVRSAVDGGTW